MSQPDQYNIARTAALEARIAAERQLEASASVAKVIAKTAAKVTARVHAIHARKLRVGRPVEDSTGRTWLTIADTARTLGVSPGTIASALRDSIPVTPRGQHQRIYISYGLKNERRSA